MTISKVFYPFSGAQASYLTPLNTKGKTQGCPAAGPELATHWVTGGSPGHQLY